MKNKIKKVLIAKDNFPLETFKGRPITNFIRRLLHGSHYECKECWQNKTSIKLSK
jgi:hypothetical protein